MSTRGIELLNDPEQFADQKYAVSKRINRGWKFQWRGDCAGNIANNAAREIEGSVSAAVSNVQESTVG